MKRSLFVLALVTLFATSAFKSFNTKQLLPTSLRVTVLDNLGNVVENAKVTIYRNAGDYESGENAVGGPSFTDSKGRVTFKNLEPKAYYVEAKKGEASNYGEAEKTNVLSKGKTNKVNIIITE
jgi:hypothetical protein